jgi:hypothetical protein
MADIKICWKIRLRRIGAAQHETMIIQYKDRKPEFGEVILLAIGEKEIRARVIHIHGPTPGKAGAYAIDANEIKPAMEN